MKRDWTQWTAGILLMLALFLTGCAEKKTEEPTSRAPFEQSPSTAPGRSGTDEGIVPTPSLEQGQSAETKEQKPAREQKPRGG
ncbi:MAG: hypothetical protein ACREQA_01860 [Candidatus Binatia bacterium]